MSSYKALSIWLRDEYEPVPLLGGYHRAEDITALSEIAVEPLNSWVVWGSRFSAHFK
jgi:hypothetical protein